MKNYSLVMTENDFRGILFRKDNEVEALYYFILSKDQLDNPTFIYIIYNNNPATLLKDEADRFYLIYLKEEEIAEQSVAYFAHLSLETYILGDGDNDGLPDDFEDQILYKYRPSWKIKESDPGHLPVRMKPGGNCIPQWIAKDGTIYGEVFSRGYCVQRVCDSNTCYCKAIHTIEVHFFDIWDQDYGCLSLFCKHIWDKEHVSVRLRYTHSVPDYDGVCPSNWHPPNENLFNINLWYADLWRLFAHEGTICDKTHDIIGYSTSGIYIYVSVKHGAYKSKDKCNIGNCCDDCNPPYYPILKSTPINVGQTLLPLNGACWTAYDGFLTDKMDPDVPATCPFKDLCR